jgi:membrane-bound lytic murein transglycosylase D
VPQGKRVAFETNFPALYRETRLARASGESQPRSGTVATKRAHNVRRGETLGAIARRYGVTVSALRSANGGVDPRRLRVGTTLRVPGVSSETKASAATRTRVHRVARGENLSTIARRYRVTVRELQRWNSLRGSRIYAGQRLRIHS